MVASYPVMVDQDNLKAARVNLETRLSQSGSLKVVGATIGPDGLV